MGPTYEIQKLNLSLGPSKDIEYVTKIWAQIELKIEAQNNPKIAGKLKNKNGEWNKNLIENSWIWNGKMISAWE